MGEDIREKPKWGSKFHFFPAQHCTKIVIGVKNDDLFEYEIEKVIRPKAALNAPFFEDFSKLSNFKIFGAFKAP